MAAERSAPDPLTTPPKAQADPLVTGGRGSDGETFEIRLEGEVDLSRRNELRAVAVAFVSDGSKHARVDLSGVTFMDSSGLGFLLRLRRISQARGGRVILTPPQGAVLLLFRTVLLDRIFEIEEPDA